MKIENQICTFEQAKKLKALGIGIEYHSSVVCYIPNIKDDDTIDLNSATVYSDQEAYQEVRGYLYKDYRYPAFTVAELGVMLADPSRMDKPNGYTVGFRLGKWSIEKDGEVTRDLFDYEAHARAELLLILVCDQIMSIEEVNKRLAS